MSIIEIENPPLQQAVNNLIQTYPPARIVIQDLIEFFQSNKKRKIDTNYTIKQDEPRETFPALSFISPIRKKADLNISKSTLSFATHSVSLQQIKKIITLSTPEKQAKTSVVVVTQSDPLVFVIDSKSPIPSALATLLNLPIITPKQNVEAVHGSNQGYLYFFTNEILFGFKKPILFKKPEWYSICTITSRTFNVEIGGGWGKEEFGMIESAQFEVVRKWFQDAGVKDSTIADQEQMEEVDGQAEQQGEVEESSDEGGDFASEESSVCAEEYSENADSEGSQEAGDEEEDELESD